MFVEFWLGLKTASPGATAHIHTATDITYAIYGLFFSPPSNIPFQRQKRSTKKKRPKTLLTPLSHHIPLFWRICWAGKGKKFFSWGKVGWDKVFRGKERMEEEEEKALRISPLLLLLLPLYGQSFDKAICYLPVV